MASSGGSCNQANNVEAWLKLLWAILLLISKSARTRKSPQTPERKIWRTHQQDMTQSVNEYARV